MPEVYASILILYYDYASIPSANKWRKKSPLFDLGEYSLDLSLKISIECYIEIIPYGTGCLMKHINLSLHLFVFKCLANHSINNKSPSDSVFDCGV